VSRTLKQVINSLPPAERVKVIARGREFTVEEKDRNRIAELEDLCGELYQVIGVLADYSGCFDHPDVQRALDNASKAKFIHRNLIPWPKAPLGDFKRQMTIARRIMKERRNALRELARR
jgi:hypothetical protein